MKTTRILSLALLSLAMAGCGAEGPIEPAEMAEETGAPGTTEVQQALELPDPSDVYIENIVASGSGCPTAESVLPVVSPDRKSFVLIFTQMQLINPPPPALKFKNCLATVRLHVPQGWQVSLATVNTRGFASLDWGIRARQSSSYFFAGNPQGAQYDSYLAGPYEDNYVFTDQIPISSTTWSACGRSEILVVDTRLFLDATHNRLGDALFNSTNVDSAFRKVFHIEWRPCP